MAFDWLTVQSLIVPLALLVASVLAGLLAEWLLIWLLRLAISPAWDGREVVIRGLRGMVTIWFALAGGYAAAISLNLSPALLLLAHQILLVGFILSLTLTAAQIIAGLVERYTRRKAAILPATSIIVNLTRLLILIIGGLLILDALNIAISPILTTLCVGALAVALALQDTLSNLFAGLQILAARQIMPGNFITLDSGEEGTVEDIGWRNATIRQLSNSLVIVPNSKLAQAIVINHNLPDSEIAVLFDLGVSYTSDLARVERITIDVAREVMAQVPGGVPDFEPFIRYNRLAEYSVNFTVIMRASAFADQFVIKHEFIKRLLPRYNAEGIDIPFPTQIEIARRDVQDRNSPERIEE